MISVRQFYVSRVSRLLPDDSLSRRPVAVGHAAHTPKLSGGASQSQLCVSAQRDPGSGSASVSSSRTRLGYRVAGIGRNRAHAKNTRAHESRHGTSPTPDQVVRPPCANAAEIEIPSGAEHCESGAPVWCRGIGCRTSSGCVFSGLRRQATFLCLEAANRSGWMTPSPVIHGRIAPATASTTGTTTALPNCL